MMTHDIIAMDSEIANKLQILSDNCFSTCMYLGNARIGEMTGYYQVEDITSLPCDGSDTHCIRNL